MSGPAPYGTFREAWIKRTRNRHLQLPEPIRHELILADRTIAELGGTVDRLEAELASYHGRTVFHCTDSALDENALSLLDEADGTVLRATDTGRELVMEHRMWRPREPGRLAGMMPMGLTFSDADPISVCLIGTCGWHAHGDSINDALLAWSGHLTADHRLDWPS